MRQRPLAILAASLAAIAVAGCSYDPYQARPRGHGPARHAYDGGEWDVPRGGFAGGLEGPGVSILDPWLKETREGRAIVTLGFREAARGFVSDDVAHRVNIWFRRYADTDGDMRITDPEIRTALVAAAAPYLR
ncbi:MAG TPA: hypothetical protein VF704_03515 [Allosphingosinicella sp.]|jgi:hypothetical protein